MTEEKSKARDWAERIVWTFIPAALAILTASPLWTKIASGEFTLDGAKPILMAAGLAGLAAVYNLISLPIRSALPWLPSPGHGLPGAETAPVQ
jgi:hypothetical protein